MASFVEASVLGLGVTTLAELGDKTFFVCALLAAKESRLQVFIGSYAALAVQTVICVLIAVVFQRRARALEFQRLRWDLIIGGAALLAFGLYGAYEAMALAKDEGDDQDLENLDEFLAKLDETAPCASDVLQHLTKPAHASPADQGVLAEDVYVQMHETPADDIFHGMTTAPGSPDENLLEKPTLRRGSIQSLRTLNDAASAVRTAQQMRNVVWKAFIAVFAAELGDRSMFSTIALAATNNVLGILTGVLVAHFLVNLAGVSCASLICRYVSEKTTNLLAGVLFIVFGLSSLYSAFEAYA